MVRVGVSSDIITYFRLERFIPYIVHKIIYIAVTKESNLIQCNIEMNIRHNEINTLLSVSRGQSN